MSTFWGNCFGRCPQRLLQRRTVDDQIRAQALQHGALVRPSCHSNHTRPYCLPDLRTYLTDAHLSCMLGTKVGAGAPVNNRDCVLLLAGCPQERRAPSSYVPKD